MGLRSWLRGILVRQPRKRAARRASTLITTSGQAAAPSSAFDDPGPGWEELPPYLPVDPREHREAVIIASAIAAGDHPESSVQVKRISMANPEYRRVACIATALGAGALEKSSFTVKRIYRKTTTEETHAA